MAVGPAIAGAILCEGILGGEGEGGSYPRGTECTGRCSVPQLHGSVLFTGAHLKQNTNRGAKAAGGATGNSAARLDVTSLAPMVHQLFEAGLAPSTRRAYSLGAERYTRFCTVAGRPPFPAREDTVMLFVSSLHKEGLAPGTVKSYLAAMRFEQISREMGDPGISRMPQLGYVLKCFKRRAHGGTRRRLPITPEILKKLRQVSMETQTHGILWVFTVRGDCYTIT